MWISEADFSTCFSTYRYWVVYKYSRCVADRQGPFLLDNPVAISIFLPLFYKQGLHNYRCLVPVNKFCDILVHKSCTSGSLLQTPLENVFCIMYLAFLVLYILFWTCKYQSCFRYIHSNINILSIILSFCHTPTANALWISLWNTIHENLKLLSSSITFYFTVGRNSIFIKVLQNPPDCNKNMYCICL